MTIWSLDGVKILIYLLLSVVLRGYGSSLKMVLLAQCRHLWKMKGGKQWIRQYKHRSR